MLKLYLAVGVLLLVFTTISIIFVPKFWSIWDSRHHDEEGDQEDVADTTSYPLRSLTLRSLNTRFAVPVAAPGLSRRVPSARKQGVGQAMSNACERCQAVLERKEQRNAI